jgi:hypothetical protein
VNPAAEPRAAGIRRFRIKLLIAMMLVVSALTSLGIFLAQRRAADDAQSDLQRDFDLELASLHRLQDLRNAAVADRSEALAQNARIHAALEDNALDLLYPSARDELRDLMEEAKPGQREADATLHARFYRFLDGHGTVLVPPSREAGDLSPNEERRLAQERVPQTMQTGYLARSDQKGQPSVDEMIAVPIRSTESNEVIAALVLGFKPVQVVSHGQSIGMKSGILVDGKLQLPGVQAAAEEQIVREVTRELAEPGNKEKSLRVPIAGVPHLLFFKLLNLHSDIPRLTKSASIRSISYSPAKPSCAGRFWVPALSCWSGVSSSAISFRDAFPNQSKNWPSSQRKTLRNGSGRKRSCKPPPKSCNAPRVFPPTPRISSRALSRSCAPVSTRFLLAMVSRRKSTKKYPR